MPVLVDYLARQHGDDLVIVSPDAGRVKVAERFAQHLDADLAFVDKRRPKGVDNAVEARDVVGDVDGRHCVLIDDMIDTAGTIVRRGRAPHRPGRHRGVGHGHPRRAVRTRPSTG